jgi:hypothetical protein
MHVRAANSLGLKILPLTDCTLGSIRKIAPACDPIDQGGVGWASKVVKNNLSWAGAEFRIGNLVLDLGRGGGGQRLDRLAED